jgi:hypothetical protein
LKACKINFEIQEDASPDIQWMIALISTFDPQCFIFHKGYIPNDEKLESKRNSVAIKTIKNFFEGLPEEFLKKKVSKNVMKRIYLQ